MGDFLKWLLRVSPPGIVANFVKGAYNLFQKDESKKLDNTFTDIYKIFKGTYQPQSLSDYVGSTFGDEAKSLLYKETGGGLTPAEQEQNDWTAMREDTRYQRSVADMQAAGLNPALMYQNGASAPSVNSSASGVAGSGSISDMLQLVMLPLQMQAVQADINKTKADTAKTEEDTKGISLDNEFKDATLQARAEAENLSPTLKRSQIEKVNKELDEIVANTFKLAEESKTEESKRELNFAAALLDKINAHVAIEMLPYSQALAEANTTAQKNYAALMAVQKLYQSKLITGGYVDAICKQMKESADSQEAKTAVDKINSDIRSGKFGNDGSFLGKLGSSLLQGTVLALDQLKGVASVGLHFGKNLGNKSNKTDKVNPAYNYDPFGYLSGE